MGVVVWFSLAQTRLRSSPIGEWGGKEEGGFLWGGSHTPRRGQMFVTWKSVLALPLSPNPICCDLSAIYSVSLPSCSVGSAVFVGKFFSLLAARGA